MHIQSYLQFLNRYKALIILATASAVFFSAFFTRLFVPVQGEITLFLSLGTEKLTPDVSQESGFTDLIDSADKFGETIKGWFRNPGFIKKIDSTLPVKVNFSSVKKQALQNLVVEGFTTESTDSAQLTEYGQKILSVIEGEIELYNEATQGNYVIATSYISSGVSSPRYELNMAVALIAGLFLVIVLLYLYELMQDKVTFDFQVRDLFPSSPILRISDQLINILASDKRMIILGCVGAMDKNFIFDLAQRIAKRSSGQSLLIEYEFEQGQSGGRGLSDLLEVSEQSLQDYLQQVTGYDFRLLSTGSGQKVDKEIFSLLKDLFDRLIIFSTLPAHSDLLFLENTVLVLIIRPGKTRMGDLINIKNMTSARIFPVIL